VGLLFLLIRAVARPRAHRQRWYLVGAAAIAPMPTAVVLGGLLVYHPGGSLAVGLATAAAVLIAWMTGWALGLRWLTGRELRMDGAAAQAPPSA
jgi:hypothetical protein